MKSNRHITIKTIKLCMNEKQAAVLSRACEILARCGMCQFKDMFEMINPNLSNDEKDKLEWHLKQSIDKNLSDNSYNSMHSNKTPNESKIAWEAYNHLRRELAWAGVGKDWRTDDRDWKTMMMVNFDDPVQLTNLGRFKVEVINKQ